MSECKKKKKRKKNFVANFLKVSRKVNLILYFALLFTSNGEMMESNDQNKYYAIAKINFLYMPESSEVKGDEDHNDDLIVSHLKKLIPLHQEAQYATKYSKPENSADLCQLLMIVLIFPIFKNPFLL